jgi:hypothetical protein
LGSFGAANKAEREIERIAREPDRGGTTIRRKIHHEADSRGEKLGIEARDREGWGNAADRPGRDGGSDSGSHGWPRLPTIRLAERPEVVRFAAIDSLARRHLPDERFTGATGGRSEVI